MKKGAFFLITYLLESKSSSSSFVLAELLPLFRSDMLGHQAMGRLDLGKRFSLDIELGCGYTTGKTSFYAQDEKSNYVP